MYYEAKGSVPADPAQAFFRATLAEIQGSEEVSYLKNNIEVRMTASQLDEASAFLEDWNSRHN